VTDIPSQIYFLFLVLRRLALGKAKNYLRTKFRPDIAMHDEDITTSICWKQTDAIFLLPVFGLATPDIPEGLKLSAYQISTRYINALSIYYYFRFLKKRPRY